MVEKQNFLYIFDYGDEWRFNIEVYEMKNEGNEECSPTIIESKGERPQQYPDYDEDED